MTWKLAFAVLALAAGVATTLQASANAGLSHRVGLGATLIMNTVIVLAGSLALFLVSRPHASFFPADTHWSLYIGGFCGFVIVFCLAYVFPKIGAAWAIALVVLGQSVAALAIDHFGWLGMPKDPITLARVAGLALIAFGASMIRH